VSRGAGARKSGVRHRRASPIVSVCSARRGGHDGATRRLHATVANKFRNLGGIVRVGGSQVWVGWFVWMGRGSFGCGDLPS